MMDFTAEEGSDLFEIKGPNHIYVDCGEANLEFQMGNFMNALNDLACFFEGRRGEEMENLVAAMRFYCDLQERYFEAHHK